MGARCAAALGATRRGCAAALALVLLAGGCTYSRQERGLFPPRPTPTTPAPPAPPAPTNPELPVLAESLWITGEGLQVRVRFAVHAVRRIAGATVLDWSATPLSAPGMEWGDRLPAWVDLGLSRTSGGDVNITLIDPSAARVYRPLIHKSIQEFNHCLCSPVWVAQLYLRIGETRMLQTTYPELPAARRTIDVSLMNSLPFPGVPVTPAGQVPYAARPTDLARAPSLRPPFSQPYAFQGRGDPTKALRSIVVDTVQRSAGLTSLSWSLESITDHAALSVVPEGPPVSAVVPDSVWVVDLSSASGPQLRVPGTGQVLRVTWVTNDFPIRGYLECLCSRFGLWAAGLRQAGGSVRVVTNFGPLPPGVTAVDVVLPGVATVRNVPLGRAPDPAGAVGPVRALRSDSWTYRIEDPPRGWATADWPTPLPDTGQLPDYREVVERLVDLPKS